MGLAQWIMSMIRFLQLEESIRDLQHQDMWVVMLVADQHAFAGPPHAMLLVVLF